jgi:phosphatidylserine decarboxylase
MSNLPRSETLELDFPMQLADRLLTEVTMRRPIMKEMRKYPIKGPQDTEGEFKMFCVLCGLREEEMDVMDPADYRRLQDIYVRFLTPAERGSNSGRSAETQQTDRVGEG